MMYRLAVFVCVLCVYIILCEAALCTNGCGSMYSWEWQHVQLGVVACTTGCGSMYSWEWQHVQLGVVACIQHFNVILYNIILLYIIAYTDMLEII